MRGRSELLVGHIKRRVALIHNTVAPYRHPLFERLSRRVDLMVYYCSIKYDYRDWDLWPRSYYYKYKILSGMLLKTGVGRHSVNPSIVKDLLSYRPHVLVLNGYVDVTMWLAFALGKILKIPIIYWTEGVKEPSSVVGTITWPLRMLFVMKSRAIVVPGSLSRNYVISLGADAKKVFIARNTIDNELFVKVSNKHRLHKEELKARLGFKSKVVILYVGQLIKRKGVDYLLNAYAKLKAEVDSVALIMLGSGPLELYLKKLANSLRLQDFKIIQSGLSLDELMKLYSIADIFVLPTLEDLWGFVVNEAMACGLPVIATRGSQAAIDMINSGENGYLVKEANEDELYSAIKKLVENPDLRRAMAKKSKEIVVSKFTVDVMANGFESAVLSVLKEL